MRIACLHVPQFALQCVTRTDPSLRGAPIAVVSGSSPSLAMTGSRALHSPIVQACSRAAWGMGVRVGMTATAARAQSIPGGAPPGFTEPKVVTADPGSEREL